MRSATTWMTLNSFCSLPVTLMSRAPSTTGRKRSKIRGHTIVLAMAVSSSSVMKMTLPWPGRCRTSTRPATVTRRPDGILTKRSWRENAARGKIGAQEGYRMRLQRQMQAPIVLDHMLARQHRRQSRVGLQLRHGDAREQRQVVLVAGALQSPHRPQRLAAVEAERTEGVGFGELFERGGIEPRTQPEVAHRIETGAAHAFDDLGISFGKSADLPEAEPQRVGGADVVAHTGMAGMEAALNLPLQGGGRSAQRTGWGSRIDIAAEI